MIKPNVHWIIYAVPNLATFVSSQDVHSAIELPSYDNTSKAFLSFGVLIFIFIVAGFIAKMVDHCYDRTTASDDSSDVSDHTRNLIRARLALVKFKLKGKSLKSDDEKKLATLRIWTSGRKPMVRPMSLANYRPSVGIQFNKCSVSLNQDIIQTQIKAWHNGRSSEHPGRVSDVILNVEKPRESAKNAPSVRQLTNIQISDDIPTVDLVDQPKQFPEAIYENHSGQNILMVGLVEQPKQFNDPINENHSGKKASCSISNIGEILQKTVDTNITTESVWERPVTDGKACGVYSTKPEQWNIVPDTAHSEQTNVEPLSLSAKKEDISYVPSAIELPSLDNMSKGFMSFGVLIFIFIVAGFIAKMVDHCYDRTTASDDSSDVSDHTRNLIRARLALMKFYQKGKSPKTDEEKKLATLRIWTSRRKQMVRRMSLANYRPSVGVQFNKHSVSLDQDIIQTKIKAWHNGRSSEHPGRVSEVIINVEKLRESAKNAPSVRQSTNIQISDDIPMVDLVEQPKQFTEAIYENQSGQNIQRVGLVEQFNDATNENHSRKKASCSISNIGEILQKTVDTNITTESVRERPVTDDKVCEVNSIKPEQWTIVPDTAHSEQTNVEPLSVTSKKEKVSCMQVEDM